MRINEDDPHVFGHQRRCRVKMKSVAKTEIGLLLTRLGGFTMENPRQAERRADYLKKVKKLVAIKQKGEKA